MPNQPKSPYSRVPIKASVGAGMMAIALAAIIVSVFRIEAIIFTLIALAILFGFTLPWWGEQPARKKMKLTAVPSPARRPLLSLVKRIADQRPSKPTPDPVKTKAASPASEASLAFDPARFRAAAPAEAPQERKLKAIAAHPETSNAEREAAIQALTRKRRRSRGR